MDDDESEQSGSKIYKFITLVDDDESEQSGSKIYKFITLVDDDEGDQSVSEIYEFRILMDKLVHEKSRDLEKYKLLKKNEREIVLRSSLELNKKFLEDDLRHFSVDRILDYPQDPNYLRLKRALELSSISSQNERNRRPSIPAKASSSSSSTPADTTSTESNSIQPRSWPGKSESTLMSKEEGSDYDVFLSFCGDDTRKGFTDHLYNALVKEGVRTFRDNEDLPVGEEIKPELLEAIKMSKFGIPIFSINYVSSKWCLLELAEMSRRKSENKLKIFPVFYNVRAEDVKLKTETFKAALLQHETNVKLDKETVEEWKAALQNVPAVKGWEREKIDTGHESKLVDTIVKCVSSRLKKHTVKLPEHLVGMRHHYNNMMELLNFDADEVQIVAIVGMGGIGKSTIARCMYNQLCESFQRFIFIANIRETAPKERDQRRLQKQLLSRTTVINSVEDGKNTIKARFGRKKVLVVLDDVDQKFQLDALAGNKDWFGRGSRIIITTRDKELLKKLEVSDIYEPEVMNLDKSLKLFSKHAFKPAAPAPPEAFVKLSRDIVSFGGGLPLFLEVVGAYLCDKDVEIWEETLVKLKKCVDDEPNCRIQKQLRISYDALEPKRWKEIFLDVACHFVGTSTKNPYYMWTALELFPKGAIDGLCNLALLKVDEHDKLRMHDLLRDLGRFIVREKNEEPCERTRLWSREDVQQVLEDKTGTPNTLTLSANAELKASPDTYPGETFVNLTKLRYLQMDNTSLDGALNGPLSNLTWLRWKRFPSNISFSGFRPRNLVILDLSYSEISWELLGQFKKANKLKVLKLTGCKKLIRTPDFSTFQELERLDLYGCTNLKEIHGSIGFLKSLVYFSIDSCRSVGKLPKEIGRLKDLEEVHLDSTGISDISVFGDLKKLKTFKASDCESLIQVSPSIVRLCSLSYLNLNGTRITELPDFISSLQKLRRLSLYKCELLVKLPDSIGLLVLLEDLDLFGCSSLNKLPETIGNLKKLNKLSISGTKIKILPDGIGMLQNLEKFIPWDFSFSERELPKWIWELSSLKMLKLDGDKISSLSDKICGFSNLSTLDLRCCSNVMLPKVFKLPQCLTKLHIPFTGASLDAAVGLRNLKRLGFNHSCLAELKPVHGLRDLSLLSKLEKLTFFGVKEIYSLQKIMPLVSLPCLKEFEVILCTNLRCLPHMPKSLRSLCLEKCHSIISLTNLSNLKKLSRLQVYNCDGLTEFPGLGGAERLTLLNIIDCRRLSNLVGLQHLRHLEELRIVRCNSLKSLPDLSGLGKLKTLCVRDIPELTKILGLQALSLVEDLNLSDCKSLKGVLSLSGKKELRRLQIHACKKVAKILDLDVDTLEYFRDQEGLVFYHGKPSGEVDVFDLKKYVRSQKPPCPRHIPKSSGYTKEELPRHVNLWVEKVEDEILSLRQSSPTEKPREGNDSDEEPLAVVRYNSDDDDFVV